MTAHCELRKPAVDGGLLFSNSGFVCREMSIWVFRFVTVLFVEVPCAWRSRFVIGYTKQFTDSCLLLEFISTVTVVGYYCRFRHNHSYSSCDS